MAILIERTNDPWGSYCQVTIIGQGGTLRIAEDSAMLLARALRMVATGEKSNVKIFGEDGDGETELIA